MGPIRNKLRLRRNPPPPAPRPAAEPWKILVVDDDDRSVHDLTHLVLDTLIVSHSDSGQGTSPTSEPIVPGPCAAHDLVMMVHEAQRIAQSHGTTTPQLCACLKRLEQAAMALQERNAPSCDQE